MRSPAVLAVLLASLAGCGQAGERREATLVVDRFYDAVRAKDAPAACEQLSEAAADQLRPSCEARVTGLQLGGGAVTAVEVAARSAVARLRSGERAFLSLGTDGWRIDALGCTGATRSVPADCEVEA